MMDFWRKLSVRVQLIAMLVLILTVFEAGTLVFTYWSDLGERRTLAIDQANTLGRSLNHDLLKVILNPQAAALADISYRLSGFDSTAAIVLYDAQGRMLYQYKRVDSGIDVTTVEFVSSIPTFLDNYLLMRKPLSSDNYVMGSVVYAMDISSYNTRLKERLLSLVAIFTLALLFGLLLAWFVSRMFSKPFTDLALAIESSDVHNNNFRYVTTQAQNEIATLYNGYNSMIKQIEKSTEEIRNAVDRKDQADTANSAKSVFLANMSHELRTPLNAIIGYSELMGEISVDVGQEELANDSKKITQAGEYLLGLINNLLDVSKIEAGKMQMSLTQVSIRELVAEVMITLTPLAHRKGNEIIVTVDPIVDTIETDEIRLKQVLINFLSNANKFTEKGNVTLNVLLEVSNKGRFILFEVSDTGVGMTQEQLSKLFTPFMQFENAINREYVGTGLGLVISKKLTELLGGNINVSSVVGRGTVLSVRIPQRKISWVVND